MRRSISVHVEGSVRVSRRSVGDASEEVGVELSQKDPVARDLLCDDQERSFLFHDRIPFAFDERASHRHFESFRDHTPSTWIGDRNVDVFLRVAKTCTWILSLEDAWDRELGQRTILDAS